MVGSDGSLLISMPEGLRGDPVCCALAEALFCTIDLNGDGSISEEELKNAHVLARGTPLGI